MNYRTLPDGALVDFAKNVEARLAAHELACLPNALADDLAAILAPLNTAYEAEIEDVVVQTSSKQSAVAAKNITRDDVIEALVQVETYMSAAKGDKDDFDKCLFNYPGPRTTVVPNDPSDLSAVGTSTGINTLRFRGNNRSGSVVYEIWRRQGDEGPWGAVGTTKRQTYRDTPVTPGQYYEYKVRAAAAKTVSNFSNSAVVYGAP